MEKRLKFAVVLSLKVMALRRVAVHLSNDFEIPFSICSRDDWIKWFNTNENKVKYKISKIPLPETLRKEMTDTVMPISLEIRKWTECLRKLLGDSVEVGFAVFYWTTAATIDYKKTADALLDCEVLDVEKRYKLASLYCLQDYLPLLWVELSEELTGAEERKKCFLRRTGLLDSCWPRIIRGDFSHLDRLWKQSPRNLTSFNQWVFEHSAKVLNRTAAEYFFRKLTHEEKEASLMRTTLDVLSHPPTMHTYIEKDYSAGLFYDVLCFLLSLMTPEQQIKIIKKHPVHVLLCFYVMFWQDLLLENVGLIWPSLTTIDYDYLIWNILLIRVSDRFRPESFRKFFITSSLDFKKYFVHGEFQFYRGKIDTPAYLFLDKIFGDNYRFVPLFRTEDLNSIACIFRNLNVTDRAALVFNPSVLNIFKGCVNRGEEDLRQMVKVCLREARLSKEDMEGLKMGHPFLRRLIGELYECDANDEKERPEA